ncbi:MAG: Hpt domain-containing protein [Deltaproteobacteria bacterium]|nr:Hpt domain-containing protein [Deltaproteobacteria bacterium]MBW2393660.1 Hpt domain-containing protein [Deltaproteobacteria bacterium]
MDLAKYRALFLEEATDHLSEMSRALLVLEKRPDAREAIDEVFRMAHSIKGMAGSLGYDAITDLSHKLEDTMERFRSDGVVPAGEAGMALLFAGLEGLETMVAAVRADGEPAAPDSALLRRLEVEPDPQASGSLGSLEPDPKKVAMS